MMEVESVTNFMAAIIMGVHDVFQIEVKSYVIIIAEMVIEAQSRHTGTWLLVKMK